MIKPQELENEVTKLTANLKANAEIKIDKDLSNTARLHGIRNAKAVLDVDKDLPLFVAEQLMREYNVNGWTAFLRTRKSSGRNEDEGQYLEITYRKTNPVPNYASQKEFGGSQYDR